MNIVNLVGYVESAPTIRVTNAGNRVASFTLRVPRRPTAFAHPQAGDKMDALTIVAWDKLADSVARSATAGRLLGVSGSVHRSTWTNDAGFERSRIEVVAGQVYYLAARPDEQEDAVPPDDDIPF